MNEVGVPCGPIYTIDQTFADPQVQHLEMARPIDHPKLGPLKAVGQAINMTRTRSPRNCARPPTSANTPTRSCANSATTTLRSPICAPAPSCKRCHCEEPEGDEAILLDLH